MKSYWKRKCLYYFLVVLLLLAARSRAICDQYFLVIKVSKYYLVLKGPLGYNVISKSLEAFCLENIFELLPLVFDQSEQCFWVSLLVLFTKIFMKLQL